VNRKKLKPNHQKADGAKLRATLLRLLAKRDYSYQELVSKLSTRGYDLAMINQLLDAFVEKGYIDDTRFATHYVKTRLKRGFGPKRIRLELKMRGIDDAIIAEQTKIADNDWLEEMQTLLSKRMTTEGMQGPQQKAKFVRFFLNRGYTHEQIFTLLNDCLHDLTEISN